MAGVFCIGIATLDYIYAVDAIPTRPEKHRARDLAVIGGGLAASASVAVARLGGRAWLATRLGDDMTGDAIVAGLAADGVTTDFCRRFAGSRSPVTAVLVDRDGERLVVSYVDPALPTEPDWLPKALPEGARAVLGDTRWPQGSAQALSLARAVGMPGVLDADRKPTEPEVLRLASHVAFSEQGLREVTGIADPRDGLAHLAALQDNWLAVTLGGEGVLFIADGAISHAPGFRVDVVDTLGAGDTWHGAFALALAEGKSEAEAIRFASGAAALKCTRFGGRAGVPDRAELEAFLRERTEA